MKLKNSTKLIVLISLMSVVLLSIPSLSVKAQVTINPSLFNIFSGNYTWNKASYTNFTGPMIDPGLASPMRILIDDSDPNYNWSKTVAENAWCTGSGTWVDPYVIENLYVNAEGTGACLFIRYTTKPFIIRNCWFDYSGSNEYDVGVLIYHSANGTITNNIMTYHHNCIRVTFFSSNNTIQNNIMLGDHHTNGVMNRALELGACKNTTVNNNFVFNCTAGLGLWNTANNTIDSNYFEDLIYTTDYVNPPFHIISCDTSKIINNVLGGVYALVSFTVSEDSCNGNIIEGNGVTSTFPAEISGLQIQQVSTPHIALQDSDYNYIGYNLLYRPGLGGIPSYDPFLIIGIISMVSLVSIFAINRRKK